MFEMGVYEGHACENSESLFSATSISPPKAGPASGTTVKNLMEIQQGNISVKSEPGNCLIFRGYLFFQYLSRPPNLNLNLASHELISNSASHLLLFGDSLALKSLTIHTPHSLF